MGFWVEDVYTEGEYTEGIHLGMFLSRGYKC